MQLQILIWDFKMNALAWIEQNLDGSNYTIVGHLEDINDMMTETFTRTWDVILCFIPPGQSELRLKFDAIFARLDISLESVIYAMDVKEWASHKRIGTWLLKGEMLRWMELYVEKAKKEYTVCTVEGISYLARTSDRVILDWMTLCQRNWADEEMQKFYELSRKYYDVDVSRRGWFIDIGANIGTSCIYFKKKLDQNVDILAFEPEANNFRLLSANLLLNGLEQSSVAENLGLSDRHERKEIHVNPANPGANSLLVPHGTEDAEIQLVSLDDYVAEKGIDPDVIKYIWIDTEGYEPIVLAGAAHTLKRGNIPVFMEFNPFLWNSAGLFGKLMETLSQIYTHFILIEEALQGEENQYPVEEI